MCNRKTSKDLLDATSSPESEGGTTPCNSPDGPTTGLFGQEVAPASRSRQQAKAKEPTTSGICGLSSPGSSASAALQQSLANRLRQRSGWTLPLPTWKSKDTPLGRRYCEQIVSGRTTLDGDSTGLLPTPMASDNRNRGSVNKTPAITRRMRLGKQIGLSMLFDGKPCPFCVGAMMGYPEEWVRSLARALAMQS